MAELGNDERAPGVSAAMRRRIGNALDAGEMPSLRGANLRLGGIVLQRTNGQNAPAMAEVVLQMRRRNIPTEGAFATYGPAAPVRRGRGTYATDTTGTERMISRRLRGQNVVTTAGRRFYQQPYHRWIIHLPTFRRRISTNRAFRENRDRIDITGEMLGIDGAQGTEAEQLQRAQAAVRELVASWASGAVPRQYYGTAASPIEEDVEIVYDSSRQPTFDRQTEQMDGGLTVDTILDRVVFGAPIFPEDMWQLHNLHECSRRRSGECGLDVIVASASQNSKHRHDGTRSRERTSLMTADQAAEMLVRLAREVDPEGALATATFSEVVATAEVQAVDEELRIRTLQLEPLEGFIPGMKHFLRTPRCIAEILKAMEKQHIWRGQHMQPQPFRDAVRSAFPFCKTPRTLLLLFLRSAGLWVEGERVLTEKPISGAAAVVRECGTPVKLLVAYYEKLGVRLILLNGSHCEKVFTPGDWEERSRDKQVSVVLNVWSNHVSCYKADAAQAHLAEKKERVWDILKLSCFRASPDEHRYDEMEELDWARLKEVYDSREKNVVMHTTKNVQKLKDGLHGHDLSFIPHYSAPGLLSGLEVPFPGGTTGIRIKCVPDNHRALRAFCERVHKDMKLKLYYKGESAGMVVNNFINLLLVNRRESIPVEQIREQREKQSNKCHLCGDLLNPRTCEIHHDPPVAEGNASAVVLLCGTCHAGETEKQELKGEASPRFFESQLSYEMMEMFKSTPRPRQLCSGDALTRKQLMEKGDETYITCLDIRGCRKNALLSRAQLPVGSPADFMRPVFMGPEWDRPLMDYAWLWVEADITHPLYDGPHLYPAETVAVLIEEGVLQANADTLPMGWIPDNFFPSDDLAAAFTAVERIYMQNSTREDDAKECKLMILACIGLWSKQRRTQWYGRMTEHESDMPGPVTLKSFSEEGTMMYCSSEIWCNKTMLPFALLPLFDEQRQMHKARLLAARIPGIITLGVMVDGLFYTGPPEADLQLRELALREKYTHIHSDVFQFKKAFWKQIPLTEQRGGEARECFKPRCRFGIDCRDRETSSGYTHCTDGEWNIFQEHEQMALQGEIEGIEPGLIKELSEICALTLDPFQAMVTCAVYLNEGGLVTGPAGVGKSFVIRALKMLLEAKGKPVRTCAYTHAATRLVGGDTIAHLLHLNNRIQDDTWFIVDEVGLLPLSTLGAMCRWKARGAKFVFFGDFQGQFDAFADRWRYPAENIESSPLLHEFCAGLKLEISEYRRGKDQALFDFFFSMYGYTDVAKMVTESRRRYPAACDPMQNPLVLCVSHVKRREVNRIQNARVAPAGATLLEYDDSVPVKGTTMQPQSMRVWEGIELIGCPRGSGQKLGIVQGVMYHVTTVSEDTLTVVMQTEYRRDPELVQAGEEATLPLAEVCTQLRPAHALCYYTAQGRSISRPMVLLDTSHQHFSVRALIVGLSRATHGDLLHIGDDVSDGLFAGERKVRQIKRGV